MVVVNTAYSFEQVGELNYSQLNAISKAVMEKLKFSNPFGIGESEKEKKKKDRQVLSGEEFSALVARKKKELGKDKLDLTEVLL